MLFPRMSWTLPSSSKFRGRRIPIYSIAGKPPETRSRPVVLVARDEGQAESLDGCPDGEDIDLLHTQGCTIAHVFAVTRAHGYYAAYASAGIC